MPATNEQLTQIAERVAEHEIAPDSLQDIVWPDGYRITEQEQWGVVFLAMCSTRRRRDRQRPAQRRALRLLRSLLDPEQLRQFRQGRDFRARGSLGGWYRLHPATGGAWHIERHGRHWFGVRSFCLLPVDASIPPADATIAHLLVLATDEAEFLALANSRARYPECWNGDYMRRMRQHRLARAEVLANTPDEAQEAAR